MSEENKYNPLTEVQFQELVSFLESITTHIPTHLAGYIWQKYQQLSPTKPGPQPCSCASSAGHWRRSIDFLREWTNERK